MKKFKQLDRVEMKNVIGGLLPGGGGGGSVNTYACYAIKKDGSNGTRVWIDGDNINQAQGNADSIAYSDAYSSSYPYGIDCPGSE
jgi:hypothetical protein